MTGLVAHEWVERAGGSEKVVEAFVDLFPGTDLYCLWSDVPDRYPGSRLIESPLARTPLRGRKAAAMPFMSRHWRSLELENYEWALVSSHAFAHHLGSGRRQRHLRCCVYVHTPARYVWAPEHDPHGRTVAATVARPFFRRQDRRHVNTSAVFAANSQFVRRRVQRAWGVDARVIYPPVDVAALQDTATWHAALTARDAATLESLPRDFALGASRFVEYKGLDKVIDFGASVGMPVVIAGTGPLEHRLRHHAASRRAHVHFVVRPSDALLRALYERAAAFVYPAIEDFGIMPVEATALGTPTITPPLGGASESATITGGGVPCSFSGDRVENKEVLEAALRLRMDEAARRARRFSTENFKSAVTEWTRPLTTTSATP